MTDAANTLSSAIELHKSGELGRAAEMYEKVLASDPRNPDALHLLGLVRRQQGDLPRAVELLGRAAEEAPGNALFAVDLAAAWRDAGDPVKAESCCAAALTADPRYAPAHALLGTILRANGDLSGAIAQFQAALSIRADDPDTLVNLATAFRVTGKADLAIVNYRQALRIRPQWPEVYNALGLTLSESGRSEEALECFLHAVKLNPPYAGAMTNAGNEALAQGDLPEAQRWFGRALAAEPGNASVHSSLLLCLNYEPRADARRIRDEHIAWARRHAPQGPASGSFPNPPESERRLRVGYVSPDFYRHPVSWFFAPILRHHDRNLVDVYCYSGVSTPDRMTDHLRTLPATWREVHGMPDRDLEALIRSDAIDILVDLTGHCAGNRLPVFARKPAPVQVSYLGYPATTGVAAIDYKVTDAVINPLGRGSDYTEHLIRLTPVFCCYAPPDDAPEPAPPPARRNGFVTFGSLHTLARLNDEVLELWGEVLRGIPSSRLLIFRTSLTDRTQQRVLRTFRNLGIRDDRLIFQKQMPERGAHLAVYASIDIALDTFPWSGHTTACEALWMGVPVVTLPGTLAASRMVASVLAAADLARLVAQDKEEFVSICRRAAGDLVDLEMLRINLRDRLRASPLMDGPGFTRRFEEELRGMWRTWCLSRIGRTP